MPIPIGWIIAWESLNSSGPCNRQYPSVDDDCSLKQLINKATLIAINQLVTNGKFEKVSPLIQELSRHWVSLIELSKLLLDVIDFECTFKARWTVFEIFWSTNYPICRVFHPAILFSFNPSRANCEGFLSPMNGYK